MGFLKPKVDCSDDVAGFVSVSYDSKVLLTSCLDGIHDRYTPAHVLRYVETLLKSYTVN